MSTLSTLCTTGKLGCNITPRFPVLLTPPWLFILCGNGTGTGTGNWPSTIANNGSLDQYSVVPVSFPVPVLIPFPCGVNKPLLRRYFLPDILIVGSQEMFGYVFLKIRTVTVEISATYLAKENCQFFSSLNPIRIRLSVLSKCTESKFSMWP